MPESFDSLYGAWLEGGGGRNASVEPELVEGYRSAWESGDSGVRECVLNFILLRPHPEGFDLVGQGLRSTDADLASHAAATALALIVQGFDLGPQIREAIEEFHTRFPDWADISMAALGYLDRAEERKTRRKSRQSGMLEDLYNMAAHVQKIEDDPCSWARDTWIKQINSFAKLYDRDAKALGLSVRLGRYSSADFRPCDETSPIAVPLPLNKEG